MAVKWVEFDVSGSSDNDVDGSEVVSWKGAAFVNEIKIGHTKKTIVNIARGKGENIALRQTYWGTKSHSLVLHFPVITFGGCQ